MIKKSPGLRAESMDLGIMNDDLYFLKSTLLILDIIELETLNLNPPRHVRKRKS